MTLPNTLSQRRSATDERVSELARALDRTPARDIAEGCACVYATGSVGRGEMGANSDLDIFIIRDDAAQTPLTKLNEIRLKARLIETSREQNFPEFSDDGEYVKTYNIGTDFLKKLGTRFDDHDNVLTARMLLLLESRAILGKETYQKAIDDLLAAYWRDYAQNSSEFLPVFLVNDISRFWKTLCLNYEERTADKGLGKRRLLNYKLKYSRLLTCYSAIVYLQAILHRDNGTVSPDAAMKMVSLSPTQRLEFVADTVSDVGPRVTKILVNYATFLDITAQNKAALEAQFETPDFKRGHFRQAKEFGDEVFELLHEIDQGTKLLRYIVV